MRILNLFASIFIISFTLYGCCEVLEIHCDDGEEAACVVQCRERCSGTGDPLCGAACREENCFSTVQLPFPFPLTNHR